MTRRGTDILCIGSVLWDIIGRSPAAMRPGNDVPGRIARVPGGVAMNVAMVLRRFGLAPILLSAVGRDVEGDALMAQADLMGIDNGHVYRSEDLPTDAYMAIEAEGRLLGAIADAHSLEAAGERILAPLEDGRLAGPDAPYAGTAAIDGNLTEPLLAEIAGGRWLSRADLRVAPASPGKVTRLLPLLDHPAATFYVNLEEAGLMLGRPLDTAAEAARALLDRGAHRIAVTDGARSVALGGPDGVDEGAPPPVPVKRVTGAGDTFMAAHIAAETNSDGRTSPLDAALRAAASHVSGGLPS